MKLDDDGDNTCLRISVLPVSFRWCVFDVVDSVSSWPCTVDVLQDKHIAHRAATIGAARFRRHMVMCQKLLYCCYRNDINPQTGAVRWRVGSFYTAVVTKRSIMPRWKRAAAIRRVEREIERRRKRAEGWKKNVHGKKKVGNRFSGWK